ncbi:MAG: ThiF family adenylyltransferase [Verrucomicrobia bacterium]|nr:ThiF family adenylyltransferase [Verrucomicrobiota bacterium]
MSLNEGRFARLEAIEWWNQPLLKAACVLVVGAGALGNEVIKNLALLGVGRLVIVDMDRVELSNLSRSVLFSEADEGLPKAECAARRARDIYPGLDAIPLVGNVLADVGLGFFRSAQVVVGALDNREARVFVNSVCARVGRPLIDGGIEVLNGIVRGFAPPTTACYECTMSQTDWDLLNKRRSCSLLARRALNEGGTPTTPTTASVVGALQAQEVVKHLHGMDALLGRGFIFEGLGHTSYTVSYPILPECGWHEQPAPIEAMADLDSGTPLRLIWNRAAERLGGIEALDLAREIVERLECPSCRRSERVLQPAERLREDQLVCPGCGQECAPVFIHSLGEASELLDLSARAIGLPEWDIVWARRDTRCLGIELAGDSPAQRRT